MEGYVRRRENQNVHRQKQGWCCLQLCILLCTPEPTSSCLCVCVCMRICVCWGLPGTTTHPNNHSAPKTLHCLCLLLFYSVWHARMHTQTHTHARTHAHTDTHTHTHTHTQLISVCSVCVAQAEGRPETQVTGLTLEHINTLRTLSAQFQCHHVWFIPHRSSFASEVFS